MGKRIPIRAAVSVALVAALIAAAGCSRTETAAPPQQKGMPPSPWIAPGVANPPIAEAAASILPPDQEVVGVVVAGKARAYSLKALSSVNHHVVNDVVAGTPISATYCDLCDCLRVFSGDAKGGALGISQIGRATDGLLIAYEGTTYSQATGKSFGGDRPIPLKAFPHERTTWDAWRKKYPETGVYEAVPAK